MKLNLHLSLSSSSTAVILSLNQQLVRLASSIINFSGVARPHVTIAMGQLGRKENMNSFIDWIGEAISEVDLPTEPSCRVTDVYLEPERNRYVFLALDEPPSVLAVMDALREEVYGRWLFQEADYTDELHVTLGYVERHQREVRSFLEAVELPQSIMFDGIALGIAGDKGTVGKVLRAWKFSEIVDV